MKKYTMPQLNAFLARSSAALLLFSGASAYAIDEQSSPQEIAQALKAAEPAARIEALKIAGPQLDLDASNAASLLVLLDDPAPEVRLETVQQLPHLWLNRRAAAVAHACAKDGDKPEFHDALLLAAHDVAPEVLSILARDAAFTGSPANTAILRDLARLAESGPSPITATTARATLQAVSADNADARRALIEGFASGAAISGRRGFLKDLVDTPGIVSETMTALIADARANINDSAKTPQDRLAAVGLLSVDTYENASSLLMALLVPTQPIEVQTAALRALLNFRNPAAVTLALGSWSSLTPTLRRQLYATAATNTDYLEGFFKALEAGTVTMDTLVQFGFPELLNHASLSVRERAGHLLDTAQREALLDTTAVYKKLQALTPSVENGAQVFKDNCASCHVLNGEGNKLAPDLDFMARAGVYRLLENVVNPNQVIAPEYFSYTVETSDLSSYVGVIAKETADDILIKGPNREEHVVPRADISTITCSEKTLMPIGWEESLGDQKLADLVAFVTTPPKKVVEAAK